MKYSTIRAGSTFVIVLFLLLYFGADGIKARDFVFGEEQVNIERFDVPGMVVTLGIPSLEKVEQHYLLKCSAVNLSAERVTGLQLILLVFDSKGNLKEETRWMEKVNLSGYSSEDFLFEVKTGNPIKLSNRVVVAVQQAIGPDFIWSISQLEKIVQSYISGEQYSLPEVKRIKNQLDTPPPLKVIY